VVIGRVQEGSPADKSGLRSGDVITAIDGRKVRDLQAVRNRIGLVRVGQQMRVDIVRNAKPQTIQVTIQELTQPGNPFEMSGSLSDQKARNGRPYVLVEAIRPGGTLERAGFERGDIILSINRDAVASVTQIRELMSRSKGPLRVLVQRGRTTQFLTIERG